MVVLFILLIVCTTAIVLNLIKGYFSNRCKHQWIKVDEIKNTITTGAYPINEIKYIMQCTKCGEVKIIEA